MPDRFGEPEKWSDLARKIDGLDCEDKEVAYDIKGILMDLVRKLAESVPD